MHRNMDADDVQIWMLGLEDNKTQWVDISEEYKTCGTDDGQATVRHPVFPDLILKHRPENNAPSFVKEKGRVGGKEAPIEPTRKSDRKGKERKQEY